MKNKKEDIFRKVMKQAKADPCPMNFTAAVMKEVLASTQEETALNPALKSLLQRGTTRQVSANFTMNVMAQIELNPQLTVYKPIIPKKVMYAIAAVVLITISLLLLNGKSKGIPDGVSSPNRLNEVIAYISSVSPLLILTLVIINILLFADFMLNRQSFIKKNQNMSMK